MRNGFCRLLSLIVMSMVLVAGARVARADHRGTPGVLTDQPTNINDVYAFVDPNDPAKVVLAMTVNGFTVSGLNPIFAPDALYQFKIDNTGDFVEDLVIQIVFGKPTGDVFSPSQGFTVIGPVQPPRTGGINKIAKTKDPVITGPIVNVPQTGPGAGVPVNTFTTSGNGIDVFCGVRDDAFTFDEIFVRNLLRGTLAAPVPPETRNPGIDFYARLNSSTIAIELPSSMLTGTLTNTLGHEQLNIWATTSLPSHVTRVLKAKKGVLPEGRESYAKTFVQHDRMAHPGVSTFLVNDENKDAFAEGQPENDAQFFTDDATVKIEKLQLDPTSVAALAATLHLLAIRFPDVLRLDVTSTTGFPADNGRRPQDDVVSFELGLLTVGAVTNEGIPGSNGQVGGNDAAFLASFPFFAQPHIPTEAVPARN